MSDNCKSARLSFLNAAVMPSDVSFCLRINEKTQRFTVYCHEKKKQEKEKKQEIPLAPLPEK